MPNDVSAHCCINSPQQAMNFTSKYANSTVVDGVKQIRSYVEYLIPSKSCIMVLLLYSNVMKNLASSTGFLIWFYWQVGVKWLIVFFWFTLHITQSCLALYYNKTIFIRQNSRKHRVTAHQIWLLTKKTQIKNKH